MAIVYSYPLNTNIKNTDELVGTTEITANGQLKVVTRNFNLDDLAEFFTVDGGLQKKITLTTEGNSGPATLDPIAAVMNIPNYATNYIFTQSVPEAIWYINHGLNKFPSVSVVNTNDILIYGEVKYASLNTLTVEFSAGFSGKAYIN